MKKVVKNKKWLTLDLQLFAGEGGEGGAPASSEPAAASSSPAGEPTPATSEPTFNFTQGWGLPKDQAAAAQVNPLIQQPIVDPLKATPPVQPTKEVFDFAGRKIEVTDPAILSVLKDVHKDYTNLQGTYTKTNQEIQELRTQKQIYEQTIQGFQQQQPPAAAQPQNQEPPTTELTAEEFMEKFYENPQAALQSMFEKQFESKVKPVIEPIQQREKSAEQERQMNEQVSSLSQKYSDFNDHIASMQEVINENPQLAAQGLETVYFVAKGRSAQPPTQAPTPEQMLADPTFVSQHIMSNPQIQQQMISQYLQGKVQANNLTPPVMGAQGGQPPAIPENRPTNLRDASKAFLKHMGW